MKNKFRYKYSLLYKIILVAFLIAWLAILATNLLRVFNLLNFYSRDLIAEITCIVFSVLAIFAWFCLINLKYVVTDTISLKLGFIDLTKGRFKTNKMLKIVQATNQDKLYINLIVNEQPQIALININTCDFEKFASCVRSKNPKVIFDQAEIEQNVE